MAASNAMPYGTWRGSSSSRMSGLMKRSLAIEAILRGQEAVERDRRDARTGEEPALGAIEGLAVRLARHLEEDVAEPVVGRVAEPDFARRRVRRVDEGLLVTVAQELTQLGVVLGLLVGRAGGVAEIDADQADPLLAEHGVGQHPGRGPDIASAVETRQAVRLPETAREAVGPVVVVVHRVPPVELHLGLLAALDHRRRR